MMNAVVFNAPGGPDVLHLEQRDIPAIAAHEVLIRVKAAGVNRPDVFQRKGNYPAPSGVAADIPGLEVAGVVAACGSAVTRWKIGDRVCALLAGGGYAEYVAVHAGHCLPIPGSLDFAAAATLPETIFTVWHNVFERGRLQAGEHFLVHGGSGGIGTTAIQLAKLNRAIVYATAGSEEQCQYCLDLGAAKCFNYKTGNFFEALKPVGVDVILDSIGSDYFEQHIRLLNEDGRLVVINAVSGSEVSLPLLKLMSRRLTITGSTLRVRDAAVKNALAARIEKQIWPYLTSGDLKTVIHQQFPLARAAKAHALMEKGGYTGRLVLLTDC